MIAALLSLLTAASVAVEPTRADLAAAYLRFERALRNHPPAEDQRARVERGFDAATLSFFTGDGERALERIDALTAELDPARRANAAERAADALALDLDAREVLAATGGRITARLRRLRPEASGAGPRGALVEVVTPGDASRRVLTSTRVADAFAAESVTVVLDVPARSAPADARLELDVELRVDGARPRRVAGVALVERPLATIRAEALARLAGLEPDGPPLVQAIATCRARARLLDARASGSESAAFLANLAALAAEVEAESRALAEGRDPYRRRSGDLWRVVELAPGRALPVRVHAPDAASTDQRVPLVVALHGAGGDETMFFEGYGLGRIRELADEHGFLVAAPRAGLGGLSAAEFDALLEALLYTHAIDVARVHVLGHSMGAGAAAALRSTRSRRIVSVVLLAGAPSRAEPDAPPALVFAGDLDPLVDPRRVASAVERERAAGGRVELVTLADRGHTLFVGDVLPRAIRWSLGTKRP